MGAISAKQFLDEQACTPAIVRFLSKARLVPESYNKSCTKVRFGLQSNARCIVIEAEADSMSLHRIEFVDKLFACFGVKSWDFIVWKRQATLYPYDEILEELKSRGAESYKLMEKARHQSIVAGNPKRKLQEHKIEVALRQVERVVRKARALGAQTGQIHKAFRSVLAEEVIQKIHES